MEIEDKVSRIIRFSLGRAGDLGLLDRESLADRWSLSRDDGKNPIRRWLWDREVWSHLVEAQEFIYTTFDIAFQEKTIIEGRKRKRVVRKITYGPIMLSGNFSSTVIFKAKSMKGSSYTKWAGAY